MLHLKLSSNLRILGGGVSHWNEKEMMMGFLKFFQAQLIFLFYNKLTENIQKAFMLLTP